jgi:hypothetical protein
MRAGPHQPQSRLSPKYKFSSLILRITQIVATQHLFVLSRLLNRPANAIASNPCLRPVLAAVFAACLLLGRRKDARSKNTFIGGRVCCN